LQKSAFSTFYVRSLMAQKYAVQDPKADVSMVREPSDQRAKDRGTLDPLIILSLLLSAPHPARGDPPRFHR
jgi:hypothetical protein